MFENIKMKALKNKIKSLEKELEKVLSDIEGFERELEFYTEKAVNEDFSSTNEDAYVYLKESLQKDIDQYKEYAKVLRVKIAFGKQKLEKMEKEKYLDINCDFDK